MDEPFWLVSDNPDRINDYSDFSSTQDEQMKAGDVLIE